MESTGMRCVLLQPNLKEDGGLLRLVGLGQVLEEVPGRLEKSVVVRVLGGGADSIITRACLGGRSITGAYEATDPYAAAMLSHNASTMHTRRPYLGPRPAALQLQQLED